MLNFQEKARSEFITRFADRTFDPFKEDYAEHLVNLNNIIKSTGEPLEGNVFYGHLENNLGKDLHDPYLPKRRSFALAALMFNNVMEIGFNAGHSALLLLTANPKLKLTCVDICEHKYTVPCFDYLRKNFGDRIELINSNSLRAFPLLSRTQVDFDLYIIDGAHDVSTAESDLYNVIQFGRKGSVICFDDSDFPQLRVLLGMYLFTGKIIGIADPVGFVQNFNQMFFINNKG